MVGTGAVETHSRGDSEPDPRRGRWEPRRCWQSTQAAGPAWETQGRQIGVNISGGLGVWGCVALKPRDSLTCPWKGHI